MRGGVQAAASGDALKLPVMQSSVLICCVAFGKVQLSTF